MITIFSLIILIIQMVIITYIDTIIYHTSFLQAFMNITEFKVHTGIIIAFVTVGFSFIYAIIADYRLKKNKA